MSGSTEIKGNANLAHVIEKQLGVDIPGIGGNSLGLGKTESFIVTLTDDHIALNRSNKEIDIYSNGNMSIPTTAADTVTQLSASISTDAKSTEDLAIRTGLNFTGRMIGSGLFNEMLLPNTTAHRAKKLIKALEYIASDHTGKIPFGCKALVESLQTAMRQDSGAEKPQFFLTPNGVGISFQF
jgi:hypothetical protein